MAAKRLLFGDAGRARMLEGSRVLSGAVRPTLGPGGRNILLQRPMFSAPLVTKDGVTVAEEIELPDRFQNMGAQLILESAVRTSMAAGDGTTTATVLAHAIYREGVKLVAAGHHPIELKRGIELAVDAVVARVHKTSKPVAGKRDIARVATISANGDKSVGKLIASAVGKVGKDGIIHVEQGTALETTIEVMEGNEIDRGFSSPYFITDMERLVARLDEAYLLLCENKIASLKELLPIVDTVAKSGQSLLVVGELQGDALSLLVANKLRGTLKVCAIMPPYYGAMRKDALGDLAAQTGARVIGEAPGLTLAEVRIGDLGRAKKIVVDQEKTSIVGGAAREDEVRARAAQINALYADTNSTVQHQQLEERLRRLIGGAALLRVGGTTDAETRERKMRIEDALFATRAAIAEGIVPGGGVALVRAAAGLTKLERRAPATVAAGIAIVRRACEAPCRQIAENVGAESSVVIERVRGAKDDYGFNAATGKMENLLRSGVVDPTMVVSLALRSASSVATLLLGTEAFMVDAPRDPIDYPESGSSREGLSVEPFLSRR